MTTPSIWSQTRLKLYKYASLAPGWDGYEAVPIPEVVITKAVECIVVLESIFSYSPSSNVRIEPCPIADGRIDLEVILPHDRSFTFTFDVDHVEVCFTRESISDVPGQVIEQLTVSESYQNMVTLLPMMNSTQEIKVRAKVRSVDCYWDTFDGPPLYEDSED